MNEAIEKALDHRKRGLTVDEIARLMHVHPRTVRKWLALAGPVIDPHEVKRIERDVASVATAMLDLIASAVEKLVAMNADPARVAASVPKLMRALVALPVLDDKGKDGARSIEEFRQELREKLEALRTDGRA